MFSKIMTLASSNKSKHNNITMKRAHIKLSRDANKNTSFYPIRLHYTHD